jgi:site-specific DNA recombinase
MKTAAIYARVSSQRQKEEQTIASQTAALLKYAEAHGYSVPSQWIFQDEGYSGSVLVRPRLERLRDLACEGSVEAVLIYSPDRLSRKYAYQVLLMEEFARHGVEILFIHSPAATTPEEQLLVQLQGMIAEYERAQIAERTRRGKRHRAQSGLVNVLCGAPYGYRYVKKSETSTAFYEVIEEQASVVRQVYRLYTEEGLSIGAIVRWLNIQGIPTRRGNSLWERTTVWAMLRNPAYQGMACFGKTEKAERQKVTRLLRRRGGFSSRSSAIKERPRKEWIAIPVPAIVSAEAFALAEERLQRNKIFASRHTKVPTLLQGMLICQFCGYAYYRTSTRTSARKLYYYRCLGSDGWRYPKGQVCTNQPVRQDYLDDLVWREVMKLLEDPGLIRNEMEHRIRELQESNPSKVRKEALAKAIARVQNGADRLLDAYQEGLLSLEQLRRRMPELKKRESALRAELQTVEASVVDRERCLRLVGNLKGFLSSLHRSAQTLDVKDRQRVLRLVVKEILVGPDTLTVKHSIPGSSPSGDSGGPSYVLRGWSDHRALRCPARWRPSLHLFDNLLLQKRFYQLKHPPIAHLFLNPLQKPPVRNGVEVASQISIHYKGVASSKQPLYFPKRILATQPRAKTVTHLKKLLLKDRLQHKLKRRLHNTVFNHWNPQRTKPPASFGNLHPPHGLWPVASTLKSCTQFLKIDLRSCRKPLHALPIHSCCPSVRLNFLPCRLKRLGSVHFVDQAEPFTSSDAVFQRRQHALTPHRSFHPRPVPTARNLSMK